MPPPEPQDTGPRPNPYRDAAPFGEIQIGDVVVPGILQSVTGIDREQDWNVQKAGGGGASATSANPDPSNAPAAGSAATSTTAGGGSAGSFGTSIWRGTKLAETITIEVAIVNQAQYDAWWDFMDVLMPVPGKKVPSLSFVYPPANKVGITRVAVKKIGAPVETEPGSGRYKGIAELIEYKPQQTAPAGKADPAKPGDAPKPQDAADKELQNLLDKARK